MAKHSFRNSVKEDNTSVQTYNNGSNVDVNKVIKETLASAGSAQKNTRQSSPSGNSVKVDNPSVQTYNDNKYSKPIANTKSDHSNTDVEKLIQDAFGKIENDQQSSWPNLSNVK
ncbi:hypothetical protein DPMN_032559 [Dreissena polymorpha]|uniref:Uncharacterized protein n=1 Tax=Dreissena polymorpha TaxID=45954 RepID=A0A9D4M3Z8_DREPO|nr:hypothetical protein DPMN_032559 [Dreissena polymorpha]